MLPTNSRQVNRNTNNTLERPMCNLYKESPPHPWRGALVAAVLLVAVLTGYALWSPGLEVTDGRYDLGRNAIWLGHGWLGADGMVYALWQGGHLSTDSASRGRWGALAGRLEEHHINDVFPPCRAHQSRRSIARQLTIAQTERFLDAFGWIPGACRGSAGCLASRFDS